MNSQAASIGSLLCTLLLSDHRILQLFWETPFNEKVKCDELKNKCYLAFQQWCARFPDHVFDTSWRFLTQQQNQNHCVLTTAIQALVKEFLELKHGEVRVQSKYFGDWQQGVISRISSAPIQAFADVEFKSGRYVPISSTLLGIDTGERSKPKWHCQVMPLLHPHDSLVNDYVQREGLHETHLHLNGSTHAEICWLRALRNPRAETNDFVIAWKRPTNKKTSPILQLVGQINPDLNPHLFHQHLRVASRLRTWLIAKAEDKVVSGAQLPLGCQCLYNSDDSEWCNGLNLSMPSWRDNLDIKNEFIWMAKLFKKLRHSPSVRFSRMLYTYILLMNEYYRLLVQSETQFGFDQFQKFTLTGLRDPAEKDYLSRFHAMHGSERARSKVGYLEGRFAPKNNLDKACQLFQAILGGYLNYLHDVGIAKKPCVKSTQSLSALLNELQQCLKEITVPHRGFHRLTLVAHFIKEDWTPNEKDKSGPFRHYPLIKNLRQSAGVLLTALAKWPKLNNWVRGIDAASNELHAPPDVFASVFRVCKKAGLTRRTYHAGEDFRHLLCGIASMWEALEFLELKNGDRIGHGTAMGIKPQLWLDRMPTSLTLSRGEWLFGVLAAWQLLRDIPELQKYINLLQRELENLAYEIFERTVTAPELERAMSLRGLSRIDLMRTKTKTDDANPEPISEYWREEFLQVQKECKKHPEAIELLWKWLSDPDVLERTAEIVSKDSDFLDAKSYVRLQQALMQKVAERRVLIETLPSSNVRISQYFHIEEHHFLRWMRVPGHFEEGDPEIMVCLGSDDPGIFAADIETEFYLLYETLRKAGISDSEALQRLSVLNERGRVYRFHDPAL